jgi:cysteine-rich repeat protein
MSMKHCTAALLAGALALAACGDDDDGGAPDVSDSAVVEADASRDANRDSDSDAARGGGSERCDADDEGACPKGQNCIDGRCVWNSCGDGVVAEDEECDDGNEAAGDECNPGCKKISPFCMDGIMQEGEECDDGNWFGADACSNSCTINECGNQRVELDEECDDGNLIDTDGCSNRCSENRCRNGRVDPGEECDDGNRDHRDGCTNACQIVLCGNEKPEDWEECDDGNMIDDDACSNACTRNECGNLRTDPGEACDGSTAEVTCSADCSEAVNNSGCIDCLKAKCDGDQNEFLVTQFLTDDDRFWDLYTRCFENEDASARQLCSGVMNCGFTEQCIDWNVDSGAWSGPCFCGSASPADCQSPGGPNGACYDAVFAATMALDFEQVTLRRSDPSYPAGIAWWLSGCVAYSCATECAAAATAP